jgi:hypothetical protein
MIYANEQAVSLFILVTTGVLIAGFVIGWLVRGEKR